MIGTWLGDYQLEEMLGRGGMGEVHRAHDTRRDRRVALKLLSEHLAHNPEYRERFRRESHVAARLQEPHVIPIHDYGEIEGRLFIDMRLVNGTDLSKILKETGPLPPGRAVDIISQVAQALDAAHSDGLVHRDVKPANVLVTDSGDFVYLVDFGVAHAAGTKQLSLTVTGNPIGTPNYMAPERFDNRPADRRVDIYALGCLLHECLTARSPYDRDSIPALMKAHLCDAPPRPSALCAGIPAALDAVVARAMAKNPDDRYATAGELAAAARNALTISPAEPGPDEIRFAETVHAETVHAETVHADSSPLTPPLPSRSSPDIPPEKRRGRRVALALVFVFVLGATILATGAASTVLGTNRSTGAPNTKPSSTPSRILSSEHTAASLFGAEPRNGTCNPVAPSQYGATTNDIEVLECPDPNSPYTRYFIKYSGLDYNDWVARVRPGTALKDFTFVRADSCFDIYTATYMDTARKLNNAAVYVFRKVPFVAEVVAPAGVADLNTLTNVNIYSTSTTALC